ncbi:M24 family metallopeptidase [Pseudodonghicola flavimaris]|uniref:Xaa-Pro peptidase family protein n=1 Tax=Pseudodonghicola flavimaris TaxID=3050036 RepID=A0ABT7F120_9RHOB|nr:Xaa-Pro peptidase family protein [Pseudodonghicola flavimaris]MDK3018306.1 Xaa-Pro peptidase family protein [Pseudodonghicola flavimaris]
MTAPARGFPESEYRARLQRAQRGMAAVGCDALLLTTEADILYFTGFLTRFWESPTRPWFLILPAAGDPVAVIPAIGAALMARGWIADIRTWPAPQPEDDGVSLLADTLTELLGPRARVGLPMGLETQLRMPLTDWARLQALCGLRFDGDSGLVAGLRAVKSEAEIAAIRATCAVAGRAFARVTEIARAGVPLDQVFRDFQRLCLEEGADWVPYLAGAAAPGGYEDVISPATTEPLRPGDVLMLDTGLRRDGYFCDFDRNYAVGPPSPAVREAHAALVAAVEEVAAALRPGQTAAQLHGALRAALSPHGEPGGGRLGHGLGLQLTEGLSLIPEDRTVLEAGMVITLEPGIVLGPGRMLVHEENVVLRETGAEFLSPPAARDIPVLEG